jgi:exodeoxyribonuclease VII large subunit
VRMLVDLLDSRINPVDVRGEISGFSRAASGHCYFNLKDGQGDAQLRCAMFKRQAGAMDFSPRDGDLVELKARMGVYEARGDLQLIVETMKRAGQGSLFEQFMQLKAKLESQGCFDPARKRDIPAMPRGIGLVTSQGAAALQDVASALARRVPHIPVWLSPAAVQGAGAAAELMGALQRLYKRCADPQAAPIDVILLVRGGGSLDDLWSFNDEQLVRTLNDSPVPIVCGVGHETDFTLADFAADLRAPTPTAAAELCATPREQIMAQLQDLSARMQTALNRTWVQHEQRLDSHAKVLSRPSLPLERAHAKLAGARVSLNNGLTLGLQAQARRIERAAVALRGLDPSLVLRRGYAWLHDAQGRALTNAKALVPGQNVGAALADGEVDLTVQSIRLR